MSTPKCPYCNAAVDPEWQYGNVVWFNCGTMVSLDKPKRAHQTNACIETEVAGLTAQRDQLLQKVQRLEEAVEILVAFGNQLNEEVYTPTKTCSCHLSPPLVNHLSPPCADCEDWEALRVVKSDWVAGVARANKAKEAKP